MFCYTLDNKRYHTLNYHLLKTFGEKVYKAVIDAGFSCPNIDGKCGFGGCAYCSDGSGEFTNDASLSITEQLQKEYDRISKKHKNPKLIAYFQAHTNTYAPACVLREKYDEALAFCDVVGLSIATRADCIDESIADLLKEYGDKTYLTVELGLQTVHDRTAKDFNRGYDFSVFLKAYKLLKERNIRVCVHIINGLYGETKDDMITTAKVVGRLRPDAVKIHLLHIVKGTLYAKLYQEDKLTPLTKDGYVDIVCRQLEVLPPESVIERITGDGGKKNLIAPLWSLDKISVLAGIDKEMAARNTYQGINFLD
ncbi:MAG: TIGR01212 family radical SAM protein [Clostridia bacterium]|nr:TIGR01212 family radical SAM protein [Clostridia bacterium]